MTDDPVRTLSREELKSKRDRGDDFVVVETLPAPAYEEVHIAGAVNLPPDGARERAPELLPDREREVVVYCADEDCPTSHRVAKLLRRMGYEDVKEYEGGKADWIEAGYPVERGADG